MWGGYAFPGTGANVSCVLSVTSVQITAATVGLEGSSLPEAVADPAVVTFLQVSCEDLLTTAHC